VALLVDADGDTRSMYSLWLQSNHYTVEEAADGREALAKAIASPPDVIVTELRLGGIDGFQLCGLLKNDRDTMHVPIVVVTGEARAAEIERARNAGADAVLIKPCLPDALLAELRRLRKGDTSLRTTMRKASVTQRLHESAEQLARPARLSATLSRAHRRYETTAPPAPTPQLICPSCLRTLEYERSYIGGVNTKSAEQWDYLRCPAGCGEFRYRHRTRKLSKAPSQG
jgi:CheY-like chemotaxis protein